MKNKRKGGCAGRPKGRPARIMMEKKTINWREEIIQLFPETTVREKTDKDEWCPSCNGLGLKNEGNYIVNCVTCLGTGIVKSCECGQPKIFGYTVCQECTSRIRNQKVKEAFAKAEKIPFEDYEGKFLVGEAVLDKEEFEDWLFYDLDANSEPLEYWPATNSWQQIERLDLRNIVYEQCEDGYEGMEDQLDFSDPGFIQAQELLDKWVKEQSQALTVYSDSSTHYVFVGDLVKKLKDEIAQSEARTIQ